MFSKRFLVLDISDEIIKLGYFFTKNNILNIIDLKTFDSYDSLKGYLTRKKLKNLEVISSLGGVNVIARSISISSVGKVDHDKEITKNIKEHLPTTQKDENVIIKHQILSTKYTEAKETVDVLVAIAKESAVIEHIEYLRSLNLIPYLLDAGKTSLFLPFINDFEKNISTAVVNIDRKNTDVVIVENGLPYFVTKIDKGIDDYSQSKVVLYRRLTSILDFYRTGGKERGEVQQILLTGIQDDELRNYIEKKVSFPVEISDIERNPLLNFTDRFEDISSFTHVIGLGLRKVYPALFEIDLIPEDEREYFQYQTFKNSLKKASLSILSALTFITIILLIVNFSYSFRNFLISRKLKSMEEKLESIYTLRAQNKTLKDQLAKISPLIKDEVSWDRILSEISKVTPTRVWLESIRSNTLLKKGDDENVIKDKILYIEGGAHEQSNIDLFVSKLEDSKLFSYVQIEGIEKKEYISFKIKILVK
jgi:Tfp pilus assembly protein PilN